MSADFTAIVYGVIMPNRDLWDDPLIQRWKMQGIVEDELNRLTLRTAYESNDPWLGFMVADNHGHINTRYVPTDPEGNYYPQRGLCFYRKALSLATLDASIQATDPGHWAAVHQAWEQFAAEMADEGHALPSPQLLIIDDFL